MCPSGGARSAFEMACGRTFQPSPALAAHGDHWHDQTPGKEDRDCTARHDGRGWSWRSRGLRAAAHSLRIMLVVLIVPFAFNAFDIHGLDPYTPLAREFSWTGFAVLVAVTAGAAVAMERIGSPNSWMIGPLLASVTGRTSRPS